MISTISRFLDISPGLNVFISSSEIINELKNEELRSGGRIILLADAAAEMTRPKGVSFLIGSYFAGDFEKFPQDTVRKDAFAGVFTHTYHQCSSPLTEAAAVKTSFELATVVKSGRSQSTATTYVPPMIFVTGLALPATSSWKTEFLSSLAKHFPDSAVVIKLKDDGKPVKRWTKTENDAIRLPDIDAVRNWLPLPAVVYGSVAIAHREDEFTIAASGGHDQHYLATHRASPEMPKKRIFILLNNFVATTPVTELTSAGWAEFETVSCFLRPRRRGYTKEGTARSAFEAYINTRYLCFVNSDLRTEGHPLRAEAYSGLNTIHGAMFLEAYAKKIDHSDFSPLSPRISDEEPPTWLVVSPAIREALRADFMSFCRDLKGEVAVGTAKRCSP